MEVAPAVPDRPKRSTRPCPPLGRATKGHFLFTALRVEPEVLPWGSECPARGVVQGAFLTAQEPAALPLAVLKRPKGNGLLLRAVLPHTPRESNTLSL